MATTTIEVWVVIDENGDYGVGREPDGAAESYETDIQPIRNAAGTRTVKLTLTVPLPTILEIEADVPDLEGEPFVTIKSFLTSDHGKPPVGANPADSLSVGSINLWRVACLL